MDSPVDITMKKTPAQQEVKPNWTAFKYSMMPH